MFACAVVGFNARVDPYVIYRFDEADAERMSRVDQVFNMRLSKPWQVAQLQPDSLVIGSSRSGSVPPGEGYNLSMPALSVYEMLRHIQHADSVAGLQSLTIGLEFETFLTGEPRVGLGFEEGRLLGPQHEQQPWLRPLQIVRDLRDTLLSRYSVMRSLEAMVPGGEPALEFFPDGSWSNQAQIWLGEPGYVMVGEHYAGKSRQPATSMAENMALFAEILRYCHSQGVDTRIYLSPEHLFLTDLRGHLGMAERWTAFHRELVELNENLAAEFGREPFPLWGFNALEGIVDERLPRSKGSLDSWFRDGIHFHARLGEHIMAQLWAGEGFGGTALNSATIDDYLVQVEQLRRDFVGDNRRRVTRYRKQVLRSLGQPHQS